MAIIQGNDILVYMGGIAVAAARSCEITMDCELKETSSPHNSLNRTYITGKRGWQVTCGYFVGNVRDVLKVGQTYTIKTSLRNSSTNKVQGSAICTQCKITATRGNIAQGSFSFKGTGPLT